LAASPAESPAILWFRNDLRLADNPALMAAVDSGKPVIPVYILDDTTPGEWALGGAQRWWLHHSLERLGDDLAAKGGRLILRRGEAAAVLDALIEESGADTVYWNRLYDAPSRHRDSAIKSSLKDRGLTVDSFNAAMMREPWEVTTKQGTPYGVFTPMWRMFWSMGDPSLPLDPPRSIRPGPDLDGDRLADWALLPTRPDWAGGLRAAWTPGEKGSHERFEAFLEADGLARYADERNRPDRQGTSRMSPHLRFGEISPRHLWHRARAWDGDGRLKDGTKTYLQELVWREFSYQLVYHNDALPDEPLKADFADFPWETDAAGLDAWQRGMTGYPIVDAGMRELYETGWMHNRVRMIVGSFLVKDLMLPWQLGEKWFWDTLVDADIASNSASWQWVAGCGADAAPFFRIFNPVLQGEKFDPNGDYVRRWVPELAGLPNRFIHKPWDAKPAVLAEAGIGLGDTYPERIVDHGMARKRALEAFQTIKRGAA